MPSSSSCAVRPPPGTARRRSGGGACCSAARGGGGGAPAARRDALLLGPAAWAWAWAAGAGRPARAGPLLDLRREERADIERALALDPESLDLQGQSYLIANEAGRLETNVEFLGRTRAALSSSPPPPDLPCFFQHAVIEVADVDAEVAFWTRAMGMSKSRERAVGGARSCFVGYGPESLLADDGGMFALEIAERPGAAAGGPAAGEGGPAAGEGGARGLAYFQVAVPNQVRVSQIYETGGELLSGYGFLRVRAPSGYIVNARVGSRRDPFELVALACDDVKRMTVFYTSLLSADAAVVAGRKEEREDVFSPARPPGSALITSNAGGASSNVSVLLLPRGGRAGGAAAGAGAPARGGAPAYRRLAVLTPDVDAFAARVAVGSGGTVAYVGAAPGTGTKVAVVRDPEGNEVVAVDYSDFEREQPPPERPARLFAPPAPVPSGQPT